MTENREEAAARLAEEAKLIFRTYKDWREMYPQGTFILHNTSETIEEAFEGSMSLITEMKPSILDEVAGEFWFDTIRFNLDSLSKSSAIDFIYRLACDTLEVSEVLGDHCYIEAWWD